MIKRVFYILAIYVNKYLTVNTEIQYLFYNIYITFSRAILTNTQNFSRIVLTVAFFSIHLFFFLTNKSYIKIYNVPSEARNVLIINK